jgi:hypothetical protein
MNVETALSDLRVAVGEQSFIPGPVESRGPDAHLAVILEQLNADIDAFVANVPGMPFKESRDFALTQTAEGTPQDLLMGLRDQAPAEVRMRGD